MNRATRRAARQAGITEDAIRYAETYVCPDCTADTSLAVEGDVAVLEVAHDATCPSYRRHRARMW